MSEVIQFNCMSLNNPKPGVGVEFLVILCWYHSSDNGVNNNDM
jgi:hypothetical protein